MPSLIKRKISVRTNKHEIQERRNNKWNVFYQDRRWKKLRHWQITNHPLCHDCMLEGRSVPAEEAHHIKPFSQGKTMEEKFELLLNPNNIVSLCKKCHDKRHAILKYSTQ